MVGSFKEFQKISLTKLLRMDMYEKIINMFNDNSVDLSSRKFTKCFNAFYRVRRNTKWQKVYYDYFNKNRNNKNITFEEILDYLYENTGNIEASFSSKMLATINPNMPIWDQYVLKNLNIKVDNGNKDEKLKYAKIAYEKIIDNVNAKLNDETTKKIIKEFRDFFPELHFTNAKILDFILWYDRDN